MFILTVANTNLYADQVNGELTIPESENGFYEPGDDVVVTMTVTDDDGNRLRLDRRDENTLRGVWLWVTGPRQDYHIVQPFQQFWILSNAGGYNEDAPVNADNDEVTIHIPDDLDAPGTYTVLFNCNRRVNNVWYGLHVYEDFQIGQTEPTETRSYSYLTCNRRGCHVDIAVHSLTDTLSCIICHTYDYNTPWNIIMHTLNGHENHGIDDCSECHLANAGINQFNHNSCFSCHDVRDASDACGGNEAGCAECHLEDLYNQHDEFTPRAPDGFDLREPEDNSVFFNNVVQLTWQASRERDREDLLTYEVHLSTNEEFDQYQTFSADRARELELTDLDFDQDYWWRVKAIDLNTDGTLSDQTNRFTIQGNLEIAVPFQAGWNMISINILPEENLWNREEGPDIRLMTERMRIDDENHNIIVMKNFIGQFYSTEFDYNDIPYWNLNQGYQVYVREGMDVTWEGQHIPFNNDIPVVEGWNIVAYLPVYELPIDAPDFYAIESILEQTIIVKNYLGQFAIPEYEFSNMDLMAPGQGYQLKVSEDVVLNYPGPLEDRILSVLRAGNDREAQRPLSDVNMSILVKSINGAQHGDIIEGFNGVGMSVGRGEVDQHGRCGFAVWGDDKSTDLVDGMVDAETVTLKLRRKNESKFTHITISGRKSITYKTNDFVPVTAIIEQTIPEGLYLCEAFQNPFNSTTSLRYGLPRALKVKVDVIDITGREVTNLVNDIAHAGEHTLIWNAEGHATGIYLIRLQAGDRSMTRKVVLVE